MGNLTEMNEKPTTEEIEEAKRYAGGWIYRISREFDNSETVPPEAVIGAWNVNENGTIIGEFKWNPNYDSKKYPS